MKYDDSPNYDTFPDIPAACVLCDAISVLVSQLAQCQCISSQSERKQTLNALSAVVRDTKYCLLYDSIVPF